MSGAEAVLYERNGAVAEVTLNRPHAHNAIDPEMACRLNDTFDSIASDADIRVVILTGAGQSFCAGGDLGITIPLLSGVRKPENEWEAKVAKDFSIVISAVRRPLDFDKPIIAAVNGHCLAAGTELLVSCDIRVAADRASFGLPEARHALIPFAGALVRLGQQISYCQAMQILLTGERLSAQEAHRIGLINEVVPSVDVLPRARAIADRIARNGPLAVRKIKETVLRSIGCRLEEAYAMEDAARLAIMPTQDAIEGPRAFFAKREPVFTGR
jgi:enoyl-CoA hydratase/carnithine racemase